MLLLSMLNRQIYNFWLPSKHEHFLLFLFSPKKQHSYTHTIQLHSEINLKQKTEEFKITNQQILYAIQKKIEIIAVSFCKLFIPPLLTSCPTKLLAQCPTLRVCMCVKSLLYCTYTNLFICIMLKQQQQQQSQYLEKWLYHSQQWAQTNKNKRRKTATKTRKKKTKKK